MAYDVPGRDCRQTDNTTDTCLSLKFIDQRMIMQGYRLNLVRIIVLNFKTQSV